MKTKHEIEIMRQQAYTEQLKAKDRRLVGVVDPHAADVEAAIAFAEGVEAGLLWATGDIRDPFKS